MKAALGPPRWIAPLHLHRNDDEAGTCWKERLAAARKGCCRGAGRGGGHGSARDSAYILERWPRRVRYLLVMTSNVYSLIQDIHALKERTPAALAAVFEKHDSELVSE